VFDDEAVGLKQEPFVMGIPEMINHFVGDVQKCKITFSETPFPEYQSVIELVDNGEAYSGGWYFCKELNSTGWLCPALLKYFEKVPQMIYFKIEDL
jgi:hypothetical protein